MYSIAINNCIYIYMNLNLWSELATSYTARPLASNKRLIKLNGGVSRCKRIPTLSQQMSLNVTLSSTFCTTQVIFAD